VSYGWPPRFRLTLEGALRVIIGIFDNDHDAAKAEASLIEVVRDAYEQGYRHGAAGEPKHQIGSPTMQQGVEPNEP
jgi:hypothetical protein